MTQQSEGLAEGEHRQDAWDMIKVWKKGDSLFGVGHGTQTIFLDLSTKLTDVKNMLMEKRTHWT